MSAAVRSAPFGSLRSRLFAAMALIATVSVALTVLIAVVLINHRQRTEAERTLAREATALASVLPGVVADRVFLVQVAAGPRLGTVRALSADRSTRVLGLIGSLRRNGELTLAGTQRLYASAPTLAGGQVVLLRPARLATSDVVPLTLSLILAAVAGVALAAALSLLVARRLGRPIMTLERAAARLPNEPGVRVEPQGPRELASLAQHFNAMGVQLESARAAERSFLLSVSHELKTPLTAIRGYAEGLADHAVDSADAAAVIVDETARLERLVGDLLDLARLGRADFRVAREPVDLAALAESARTRFAALAVARGVTLELEIAPDAVALADHDRLLQVLSNLIENALRSTPRGGRVTVATASGSVNVGDDGPGIAQADLPHAFERFYLHRRAGAGAPGTGLGLAIVAELVAAMGGRIDVRSAPGAGTSFEVSLPTVGDGSSPSRDGRER